MSNVMLRDSDWSTIDGELCRVIDFMPMAGSVKNGKVVAFNISTPYASVSLECKKMSGTITGFVTHKMDFANLWEAFKERGISDNEEVIIVWLIKHYKNIYKFSSPFLPRMWVMICHKGAWEMMVNPNSRPDLTGEARARATIPIVEWKPEVME